MTLEKKIRRSLGVFAIISGICITIILSITMGQVYTQKEYDLLSQTAIITSSRFDDVIAQSEMVNILLLSDPDTLTAISNLAQIESKKSTSDSLYFNKYYSQVRSSINNYFAYRQFYRAIFYNENGDVIAGNSITKDSIDEAVDYQDVPDISGLSYGQLTIVPCHIDIWGKKHKQTVLSVIKRLVGNKMGYIEVQWTESDLRQLLQPADGTYDIILYDSDGEQLYNSNAKNKFDYYQSIQKSSPNKDYFSTSREMVAFTQSQSTDVTTVIVNHKELYKQLAFQVLPWILLLMTIFFTISFIYAKYSAQLLTKPINTLRSVMEQTTLHNIAKTTPKAELYLHSSEEIRALYQSFFTVIHRLGNSIEQEKRLSVLQLQAQFDLLQAQVNPHFLYNVLNVISAKSIMNADENNSICDMCSCLGQMLRYSTNTKEKLATIRNEIDYLQLYFSLLKYRYEDRLHYNIQVSPAIEEEIIPKVVLQQLVENCITHGYSHKRDLIKIIVTGKGNADCWMLNIHDGGSGFSKETKLYLESQMIDIRQRLSDERNQLALEIGGMGLVNTFARLFLVYGNKLTFLINSDEFGSDVSICIDKNKEEL